MRDKQIKLLLVEDDADDILLLHEALREIEETCFTSPWRRSFHVTHAGRLSEALNLLQAVAFDVVLLELFLPDSAAFHTFVRVRAVAPEVPIVVLSSLDDENLAVRLLREGAQDYLLKGDLDSAPLARSVRYAIERNQLVQASRVASGMDELTGLYNRGGFLHLAGHLLRLGGRWRKDAVLALLNIGGLDDRAEAPGRDETDSVLIETAELLRETLIQADVLARLDDNRFAILLLEASRSDVEVALRQLELRLRRRPANWGRPSLTLTVGIAEFDPDRDASPDDLLRAAEEALCENGRVEHRSGCHV